MIKYSTQVEGYGTNLKTTVIIGNQTFTMMVSPLDNEDQKTMSQREYHQFFADQMKKALDKLVRSASEDDDFNDWYDVTVMLVVAKQKKPLIKYRKNKWVKKNGVWRRMYKEGLTPTQAVNLWALAH